MLKVRRLIKSILPDFILEAYYEKMRDRIFFTKHGYHLNVEKPVSFNDKLYYRKCYGNFDTMAMIADKYRVREYIEQRIGSDYLIPLLGTYDSFSYDDWNKLPNSFVLKTNHGSGPDHVEIVKDKNKANPGEIIKKFRNALNDDFGLLTNEPFYQKIQRKIIAETYLESGMFTPDDFKFQCFGDELLIQVDRGRYENHQRSIFDRNWVEMDYKLNSSYSKIDKCAVPDNLSEMIRLAEILSKDFDYIRIDFFNIDGKIYIGELTQTHGNGLEDFKPTKIDFEWGGYWKLDIDNELLYRKRY
ncbi:ATP-grasp fold amidoligase family protein [Photobacterium chitinilyticum]|uniref:Glycosyltransferase n=1 Tax=Photobacterium chitinilyticum TaxID=2485123 RepID=A0A444JU90_9GAMM|nr:ATP-grasp fold amidoligase family protein [Photobacterium chitinilyticum]RWX56623.1 glycosyltransferase [Photobacterium chitinilyticum]